MTKRMLSGWGGTIGALALVAALVACGSSTAPTPAGPATITLSVSGGFAGVDWQYTIDARSGEIVGDRCGGPVGCDWQPGDVLATFNPADLDSIVAAFFNRDFFDGPVDFGTECCDQFDYVLSYRDDADERSVHGSDGTIPGNVQSLILLIEQFVQNARG